MFKRRTYTILTLTALMLFPFISQAKTVDNVQDNIPEGLCVNKDPTEPLSKDKAIIKFAQNTRNQEDIFILPRPAQSIQAESQESYLMAVSDKNNKTYFNQYVEARDLTPVNTRIEVIDSYSYQYNGRIFTNRIRQINLFNI